MEQLFIATDIRSIRVQKKRLHPSLTCNLCFSCQNDDARETAILIRDTTGGGFPFQAYNRNYYALN